MYFLINQQEVDSDIWEEEWILYAKWRNLPFREEQTQERVRKHAQGTAICFDYFTDISQHVLLLLEGEVRVPQLNSEIRSVINAYGSTFSFIT